MSDRLNDVLNGQHENYILPFFWVHGEEEPVLREMLARVQDSGIQAVCVESRPHPDFVGRDWWRDMDVILDEARKRNMKVWILDDAHFPTGYAAGRIKSDYPELRKWYLDQRPIDVLGPNVNASFLVADKLKPEEKLVAVVAYPRDVAHDKLCGEPVILTDRVRNGRLYWAVPNGLWRVFVLVQTRSGGEERTKDYLNPIVPEATDVLIETVYQSHYDRYANDFGETIAGFFSDEPRFGNALKFYFPIGRSDMVLPWREGMLDDLNETWGGDFTGLLPLLWCEDDAVDSAARSCFMELVSHLYAQNFSGRLGNWCRKQGVEYIGHVLEDNNVHARLGWGAGHFYRALNGQDMSGIDIVLQQLRPGMDFEESLYCGGPCDGEFYHYGLAKMGASLGHLNPRHKGRTMCEIFGAFGWACGLSMMKWMADHMLVGGVNYFVPHAFTAKDFPDRDCPPHFYGHGHNPQYRYFKLLMDYMNRLSHLLSAGTHVAQAAVLYHAEAEWGGEFMLFQKPVKELLQAQIDCDVVPADYLINGADVTDGGQLTINGETFQCLVVPYAAFLPEHILLVLEKLMDAGLAVYFVEALPAITHLGFDLEAWKARVGQRVQVLPLDQLAPALTEAGYREMAVSDDQPWLRYYHYRQSGGDRYMLFNAHPHERIDTDVLLPQPLALYQYDAMENVLEKLDGVVTNNVQKVALCLSPGESVFWVTAPSERDGAVGDIKKWEENVGEIVLEKPWHLALATATAYPHFQAWKDLDILCDLSQPDHLPDFCGTIRYQTVFTVSDIKEGGRFLLDLGAVYETAEVLVNGQVAGVRLAQPYRVDISDFVQVGENVLEVLVTNTVVKAVVDRFSTAVVQDPTGLLGPVVISQWQ